MLAKFSNFRRFWDAQQAVNELNGKIDGFESFYQLIYHENKQNDGKYHSTRHMLFVASIANWLLEEELYRTRHTSMLSEAALYIACMMHDFKHSTGAKDDDHNIEIACINLPTITARVWQMPPTILRLAEHLISITRYPFLEERMPVSILECVIRDADILYALTEDKLERFHILSALQKEIEYKLPADQRSNLSVEQLSEMQRKFYSTVTMYTRVGTAIMEEFLNAPI